MTYDEALAVRWKWMEGATAEWLGFEHAKLAPGDRPHNIYKHDPYKRQRYEQGLRDGEAVLMCAEVAG